MRKSCGRTDEVPNTYHVSRIMFHGSHLTWLLSLSILLLACANGRQATYQTLLTEYQNAPTPEYYRTEVLNTIGLKLQKASRNQKLMNR
jgi:hypothetical protein